MSSTLPIRKPISVRTQMQQLDNKLKEASGLYEKQFLREMVKAMRKTVTHGGLTEPNMAEKIFSEKLDHEYVEKWGGTGGVGLANIIYTQLKDRFFSNRLMTPPQGPIPMDQGTSIKIDETQKEMIPVKDNRPKDMSLIIHPGEGAADVTAPWGGKIMESFKVEDGGQVVRLSHANGLVSTLQFQGEALNLSRGDVVTAGESLGEIRDPIKSVAWRLVQVEDGLV